MWEGLRYLQLRAVELSALQLLTAFSNSLKVLDANMIYSREDKPSNWLDFASSLVQLKDLILSVVNAPNFLPESALTALLPLKQLTRLKMTGCMLLKEPGLAILAENHGSSLIQLHVDYTNIESVAALNSIRAMHRLESLALYKFTLSREEQMSEQQSSKQLLLHVYKSLKQAIAPHAKTFSMSNDGVGLIGDAIDAMAGNGDGSAREQPNTSLLQSVIAGEEKTGLMHWGCVENSSPTCYTTISMSSGDIRFGNSMHKAMKRHKPEHLKITGVHSYDQAWWDFKLEECGLVDLKSLLVPKLDMDQLLFISFLRANRKLEYLSILAPMEQWKEGKQLFQTVSQLSGLKELSISGLNGLEKRRHPDGIAMLANLTNLKRMNLTMKHYIPRQNEKNGSGLIFKAVMDLVEQLKTTGGNSGLELLEIVVPFDSYPAVGPERVHAALERHGSTLKDLVFLAPQYIIPYFRLPRLEKICMVTVHFIQHINLFQDEEEERMALKYITHITLKHPAEDQLFFPSQLDYSELGDMRALVNCKRLQYLYIEGCEEWLLDQLTGVVPELTSLVGVKLKLDWTALRAHDGIEAFKRALAEHVVLDMS
jgi:hypothetical protein